MSLNAERTVADFVALAEADLRDFDQQMLSDEQLSAVMTAAVRVYAARCEALARFAPPLQRDKVTATDVLVATCEMIRVADVNLFELSMWHGRPRPQD